jgi:hypothetical protein
VLLGGRRVSAERLARLVECLEAGLNPLAASRAAGVSHGLAYQAYRADRAGAAAAHSLATARGLKTRGVGQAH